MGQIRAELLEHVVQVDELDGGHRFWVPKFEEHLPKLADFVNFESGCCSFLAVEIALARGADRISLSVSGETKAKALLRELLAQAEFELEQALQRGSQLRP